MLNKVDTCTQCHCSGLPQAGFPPDFSLHPFMEGPDDVQYVGGIPHLAWTVHRAFLDTES